jgi:hypothetical protein
MPQTGLRSGLLLAVVGLWVLLRTINADSTGRTLVDHLIGNKAKKTPASALPAAAAATGVGASVSAAAGLVDTRGGGTAVGKAPTNIKGLLPTTPLIARGLGAAKW